MPLRGVPQDLGDVLLFRQKRMKDGTKAPHNKGGAMDGITKGTPPVKRSKRTVPKYGRMAMPGKQKV